MPLVPVHLNFNPDKRCGYIPGTSASTSPVETESLLHRPFHRPYHLGLPTTRSPTKVSSRLGGQVPPQEEGVLSGLHFLYRLPHSLHPLALTPLSSNHLHLNLFTPTLYNLHFHIHSLSGLVSYDTDFIILLTSRT